MITFLESEFETYGACTGLKKAFSVDIWDQ